MNQPARVAGLAWPRGSASLDRGMVTPDDLRSLHQVMWNWRPDTLHYDAGALRLTERPPESGYDDRWDAEDLRLLEIITECPPWDDPVKHAPHRPWRTPPRGIAGSYFAWSIARTVCSLPELVTDEAKRRGVRKLDGRGREIRDMAGGIHRPFTGTPWRAADVTRFIARRISFHPLTAATVAHWLAELSTGWPRVGSS